MGASQREKITIQNLTRHLRIQIKEKIQNNEKPYHCAVCAKQFAQSENFPGI